MKGRGWEEQRDNFKDWYKKRFKFRNCIYIIFDNRKNKCVYVGRSENGGNRPASHFDKKWVHSSFRIDVYGVKAKSQLSKLECLSIHRFEPKNNYVKAAKHDLDKHCPICKGNRTIKDEFNKIFRIRG